MLLRPRDPGRKCSTRRVSEKAGSLSRARVRAGTLAEQERVSVTPGSGDVWGRGRGLLAGGVGVAEPRAEESVPDGDAEQLPEPGVAG